MERDIFPQQIRELLEMQLYMLQTKCNPGERWIRNAPSELVQAYLSLKILERLESIDDTLITVLNPSGKEKP